jgi:hypothetical protein
MANEARQLADLLGYAGAMEHLHQHALRLEAIADELERDLSDEEPSIICAVRRPRHARIRSWPRLDFGGCFHRHLAPYPTPTDYTRASVRV